MKGQNNRFAIKVEVRMPPADVGPRRNPIRSGYRPVCRATDASGHEILIGLCELLLDAPIGPGESGIGNLVFFDDLQALVREVLPQGTEFGLTEPPHIVATARVIEVPAP